MALGSIIPKKSFDETIVNPEQIEATEAHPWFIHDLVEDVIGADAELKEQTEIE